MCQIRDGDGVHIVPTAAAGQWLDASVLPEMVQVGRLQMAGHDLVSTSPVARLAGATNGPHFDAAAGTSASTHRRVTTATGQSHFGSGLSADRSDRS